MNARRWLASISVAVVLVALSACGASAPARFYTLTPAASPDGLPAVHDKVAVAAVTIPSSVDQPQFVTEAAQSRVEINEFNRWVSPLNDNISRVVAQNLIVLLGTPEVAAGPLANFVPDYVVAIQVQRFESVRGHGTVLEAVWTVHSVGGGVTRAGRTTVNETVPDDTFTALATAHSQALAKLSADIATTVRAEAHERT